jgi:hypothetical protein
MWEICYSAEDLLASLERLCSMEFVNFMEFVSSQFDVVFSGDPG